MKKKNRCFLLKNKKADQNWNFFSKPKILFFLGLCFDERALSLLSTHENMKRALNLVCFFFKLSALSCLETIKMKVKCKFSELEGFYDFIYENIKKNQVFYWEISESFWSSQII